LDEIEAGMIGRLSVAGALAVAFSVTGALADGTPAAPEPSCDFFQAQLIGLFCGHTAFVEAGGEGTGETIKRTTTDVSHFHGHGFGGGTTVEKWNYQNAYESMTLAISPWQGVQFHVTGEAFQYDDSYSSLFTGGGGHFGGGPTLTIQSASGAYGGWQGFGGAATLWDSHMQTPFGNVRYLLNVVGDLQFLPGGGLYGERDLQQIGWESGAELPLGGSGLALDYYGVNLLQHLDNHGFYEIQDTQRVLLADDAYGWAIGPRLEETTVLWHAPGVNTGWSETRLGGELLLEPFRRTTFPLLRDMTLDLAATHSLGQAALVPDWAGNASQYVYEASARFNFTF
jgi:hypothetical protein